MTGFTRLFTFGPQPLQRALEQCAPAEERFGNPAKAQHVPGECVIAGGDGLTQRLFRILDKGCNTKARA